jgi:hypothetical protein
LKLKVRRFKNLSLAIKELKPFIVNGEHLQTGKPFGRFGGLRSREILANWLLCVATGPDRLDFTSDPQGGDGIIVDGLTGETWNTEHALIPSGESKGSIEERLLAAVDKKHRKGGMAYASGKTLVLFLNSNGGEWLPTRVAENLPKDLHFEAVWIVGLHGVVGGAYTYFVTRLDLSQGHPPMWKVHINSEFDSWRVE